MSSHSTELPAAHYASHETRVVFLAIGDWKLLTRVGKEVVPGPGSRTGHAADRVDERHHRYRVAADVVCQSAGFAQHFLAVLNAHQRGVDAREHLQYPGKAHHALLGQLTGPAQVRIRQRAFHRWHQALGIALQNVVDRAAFECLDGALFADRAGEKNEGDVGSFLACDGECRHAIELRQAEVRENEIRQSRTQRRAHRRCGRDALVDTGEAAGLQAPDRQLRIRVGVFNDQHPQLRANLVRNGLWLRHVDHERTCRRASGAGNGPGTARTH